MAAGTIPKPGTVFGPCETPCQHRDCAVTRSMAAALCTTCNEPIGYEARFYLDDADSQRLHHAVCLESILEHDHASV